jgi:epoxyqueuosine reductase
VRRFSQPTRSALGQSFYPAHIDRAAPRLADVLQMDDPAFRAVFKDTAVSRARRRGLVRNACVAAGNSGDRSLVPALRALREHDAETLVREHAAWALARLEAA